MCDGVVEAHYHSFRLRGGVFDREANGVLTRNLEHGDGAVPLRSAQPHGGLRPGPIAQQHAPLASCTEATDAVRAILLEGNPDERLGAADIGIDLPDSVDAGTEFAITLTGLFRVEGVVAV